MSAAQQPATAVRPTDVRIVDRFTDAETPCELTYGGVHNVPQRVLLGPREAEVLDAADEALDVDDWANDSWWER